MAVQLDSLVGRLRASLNAPGEEFFAFTDTEGIDQLANGFWWARMRGFFTEHRVSGTEIIALNGADELSDVEQQVVVCWTAMVCLENKLAGLVLSETYRAPGGLEASEERSSTLLRDLHKARRAEMDELKDQLAGSGRTTAVAFIDAVCARSNSVALGDNTWVR